MSKTSPLIAAILGALILVLQQALSNHNWDLKVVGFAALIAVIGAASTVLRGKGSSFVGILGTVGYTFVQIWQTGTFTWSEFILTSLLAVIMLFAPTAIPQPSTE